MINVLYKCKNCIISDKVVFLALYEFLDFYRLNYAESTFIKSLSIPSWGFFFFFFFLADEVKICISFIELFAHSLLSSTNGSL